jgi:hypothetical protein
MVDEVARADFLQALSFAPSILISTINRGTMWTQFHPTPENEEK